MNIIECYTDCSYSPQTGLLVIGYKIGDLEIVTELLQNIKNTQGEIYAVEKVINTCDKNYPNCEIIIYTDCQRVIKNNYQNVNFIKVKGHSKKIFKNKNDLIFSTVDKRVRKELRKYVKNIEK